MVSAVKDGKFSVGIDANKRGLGLNAYALAKEGCEFAAGFRDRDHGATLGNPENGARLAVELNQISDA